LTPSRVSARIKGEVAEGFESKKNAGPMVLRVFQERGLMPHSYRDIVNSAPEVYTTEQVASLASEDVEAAMEPDRAELLLSSDAPACSHCLLRVRGAWLSACTQCPGGQICAYCLARRYGEVRRKKTVFCICY
jgi:hypothetical protein